MRTNLDLPVKTLPKSYVIYEFRAPDYSTQTWSAAKPGTCYFGVMLSGHAELDWQEEGRRRRVTTNPGDVLFWGLGPGHWERNLEHPRVATCWISVEWARPPAGLPHLVSDRRGLLRTLAFEMLAINLDDLPAATKRRMLNAFFVAFVAEYQRLGSGHPQPLVEKLRLYVKEHIREPCRLADLARHFGVGVRQFCRRYKAATSRTPIAEVRWVKAEHARIAILNVPGIPMKDVARRVGLRSDRQLRRLIKHAYGVRVRDLPRMRQAHGESTG